MILHDYEKTMNILSLLVDPIEFSFSCIECTGMQTDVQTGEVVQTEYELLLSNKELKLNCELNSDCPAETQYIHRLLIVVFRL